jgi:raffinose/stachyose/melibiose transport system permease protein
MPGLAIYAVVMLYPFLRGSTAAFTDWKGVASSQSWIGLDNFRALWADSAARGALSHTLFIAVAATVVQNSIGLALAVALHAKVKMRNALRTAFFAPALLSPIVVAYTWRYLYQPDGIVSDAAAKLDLPDLDYLGDPHVALYAVLAAMIWQFIGYSMVIFLAAIESIPKELYEAADMDGANGWQRFRFVTVPGIAPAITVNIMLTLIGGLKAFDVILAMTAGGPGYATETLSTVIYKDAFSLGRFGYASALSVVLAIVVAGIAYLQLRVLRRREIT